ncbi:hypothetical protein [Marinobacter sp.]|nr:hypothetical protein [Marinobacter sp.]MBQ0834537.1 hypothetical protein [Marinobacter sp.]
MKNRLASMRQTSPKVAPAIQANTGDRSGAESGAKPMPKPPEMRFWAAVV